MSEDTSPIEPEPFSAPFGGRMVSIVPLTVGQLPGFARALKPVVAAFPNLETFGIAEFFDVVAEHGERVVEATSIATGVPVAELNKARPDALLPLALAAVKVNADFFARSVLPAMAAVRAQMPQGGAGPTPSTN